MITEASKRATAKYKKENIVQKKIEFNRKTDADILSWIENKTFSAYIKQLIRDDISKHEAQCKCRTERCTLSPFAVHLAGVIGAPMLPV